MRTHRFCAGPTQTSIVNQRGKSNWFSKDATCPSRYTHIVTYPHTSTLSHIHTYKHAVSGSRPPIHPQIPKGDCTPIPIVNQRVKSNWYSKDATHCYPRAHIHASAQLHTNTQILSLFMSV